jgi:formamidopyrimidine-DNA glycosylase
MPELPDVEVFRRYVESTSLNQDIERIDVLDQRILQGVSENNLSRALVGCRFISTLRHGKYLFAGTNADCWLALHFGMTGYLRYLQEDMALPDYTRVCFRFENGNRLVYVSMRMLGEVGLTADTDAFIEERGLGPDALLLDLDGFLGILGSRRGSIKAALTNQAAIAGIGNIYADEILFQARVHPKRQVSDLSDDALRGIYEMMHTVTHSAIEAKVDVSQMPERFLLRSREAGSECPRCGTPVETTKISGRTTYFCPTCQPEH